jgi:hypothetical protein
MIRRPQSLPTGATPPVKAPNGNSAAAGAPKADAPPREEPKSASGEVVSLDAFRKK